MLKHIQKRREAHNFEPTDETIVEVLARAFADWIYLENYATRSPKLLAKYADALNKLSSTILHLWDQLILTPKARRQIFNQVKKEIEQDPKVQELINKLMGTAGTKGPG